MKERRGGFGIGYYIRPRQAAKRSLLGTFPDDMWHFLLPFFGRYPAVYQLSLGKIISLFGSCLVLGGYIVIVVVVYIQPIFTTYMSAVRSSFFFARNMENRAFVDRSFQFLLICSFVEGLRLMSALLHD